MALAVACGVRPAGRWASAALAVALGCVGRGLAAATSVTTFEGLRDAIEDGAEINVTGTLIFTGMLNIPRGTRVSISGGEGIATLHARGGVRLFYVYGGSLALSGLVLSGGSINYGGAIYLDVGSSAKIRHCTFLRNRASKGGGAIFAKGSVLSLYDVAFEGNEARRAGGNAVYVAGPTRARVALPAADEEESTVPQDFFFNHDFTGSVDFHCSVPKLHGDWAGGLLNDLSDDCTLPTRPPTTAAATTTEEEPEVVEGEATVATTPAGAVAATTAQPPAAASAPARLRGHGRWWLWPAALSGALLLCCAGATAWHACAAPALPAVPRSRR